MSDIPLTEKRFIELFSSLFKTEFEKSIEPIKKDIRDLKGFNDHEAHAIEYELQQYLKDYLQKKYPLKIVCVDKIIKAVNDPYDDHEITELDAPFLLKHSIRRANYSRLKEAKLSFPSKEKIIDEPSIFIIAEAKHYIDYDKVKTKLGQFDEICTVFELAKNPPTNVTPTFIKTLQHNKYLTNIGESFLVFGAAYWEKRLLFDLEESLETRKDYIKDFLQESGNNKIELYKKICRIESKWYYPNKQPNRIDLPDDKILALKEINGAMSKVIIIKPSGGRFVVGEQTADPVGISQYSLQGGKTRRRKSNNKIDTNPIVNNITD